MLDCLSRVGLELGQKPGTEMVQEGCESFLVERCRGLEARTACAVPAVLLHGQCCTRELA